jgi:ribosomal protein S18 acetylase RimI-like enzyme
MSRDLTRLSQVPPRGRAKAVSIVVSAFADDPVERWLWPADDEYTAHFPAFVGAFAGSAFERQTAWMLDDFSAVALWLAPGAEPDGESIVAVLSETVAAVRHEDTFAVLQQMEDNHPTAPHWYLPWLAVEHQLHGKGLGSTLLTQCLSHIDASGLPAYLETPNPRTIPLYERHGFKVTAVAQAGDCPPITQMLRAAG